MISAGRVLLVGFLAGLVGLAGVQKASGAQAQAKQLTGIAPLAQQPELPTGCEATSLTMLLRWDGWNVTKTEVAGWLPHQPLPYLQHGVWFGGDPHRGFVGSPFASTGYGVYHEAIFQTLQAKEPQRAVDLSGQEFGQLLRTVDGGSPVIAWVTIGLAEPYRGQAWQAADGRFISWTAPEHAVVLLGYSPTHVLVADPLTGSFRWFSTSLFQQRWEQMGRQAVTLRPE